MVRRLALLSLLLLPLTVLLPRAARAQHDGLLLLDDPLHRFLLDQQTAGHLPAAHLTHRPLAGHVAWRYLDTLAARRQQLSPAGRRQLAALRGEAPGPLTRWVQQRLPFYANGRDLFAVRGDDYGLQVNPLFYFKYGRVRRTGQDGRPPTGAVWQNTRGLRISGHVTDHIFFETRLRENQRRDAWPVYRQRSAPRLGYTKFNDGVYDYFLAEGMVGFRSDHFEVRFGRTRNHWGPGRTSLLLSDYAPVYTQLQIRTTFWRVQYANLFTEMSDLTPLPDRFSGAIPRKYGAFHRLSIDLPGRVEVGLFEAVIFAPDTTGGVRTRNDLALAYLNPLIFYRAVEHDLGSPDNVLLGADVAWSALPGLRLYGQFLLDELVVGEIGEASWRNKWGVLAGVHLVGLPLDGLSLRAEYARLRPYLYSHRSGTTSFTHYNDLLGHPAGPNAQDVALFATYRPTARLEAGLNLAYTVRGRNADSLNYGADPLESYDTRACLQTGDCLSNVPFLQGIRRNELLVEARLGYELLPNLYLEAALRARALDDAQAGLDRYVAPFLLMRWGLPLRSVRY